VINSTNRLALRLSLSKDKGNEETIAFDKDDDDALDFVCAAANMRSIVYGIPTKTRWEVKGKYHISTSSSLYSFHCLPLLLLTVASP
jgi:Ubiquitin-activating enzyme, SCCH domain